MKQFKCVVPYLPPQFQYFSKHGYNAADPFSVCAFIKYSRVDITYFLAKHFLNIDLSLSDAQTLLS